MKLVAALLGLAALVLAGLGLRLATKPSPVIAPAPAVTTHAVVVTTRAVMAGQRLGPEDLRVERFPLRPIGSYQEPSTVIGMRPALDLGPGTPVLEGLTASGLASRIPPGERAVAVRVDEVIGIGHRVRPGDTVDLFLLLKQAGQEVGFTQARLLLPAVRVLGYGSESIDGPASAADAPPREGQGRREPARTAIVSVPLAQVNHLLLAAGSGQLSMALRHPDDRAQPASSFLTLPAALPLPRMPGEPAAIDRAAAGLRLDMLSATPGSRGAAAHPVSAFRPRPRPAPARGPSPASAASRASAQVEILRPGGRETIPY